MHSLALADDLTGALEVGAKFVGTTLAGPVVTLGQLARWREAGALVVDTETRHVTPDQACATVAQAAAAGSPAFVYKKTDSTLRGNIAAELASLGRTIPGLPIIYVPGYPEMGRTVINGRLLVDGVPVSRSAFADDPLNPVQNDDIPALVQTRVRALLIEPKDIAAASEPAVYVVNAATSEDVREAAAEFHRAGHRLAAGPAGFAGRLAERAGRTGPLPVRPPIRTCVLVNGSLHPRSVAQVRAATELCKPVRGPDAAIAAIARFSWILLETESCEGTSHSEATGRAVEKLVREAEVDAVVVFGGDTAFGILRQLGEPALEPVGEVLPGVPAARIDSRFSNRAHGAGRDLLLVTKAGGFGPLNLIAALQAALSPP